jgi:putative transposase
LNPVRVKIVRDPREYPWSSYKVYAYGKRDQIVDEHAIYEQPSRDESERRENYKEFVKGMLRDKDAMKGEMNRKVIYGNETFRNEIKSKYKIQEMIRLRGRQKGWRKKIK